jgi:hypothetical protein
LFVYSPADHWSYALLLGFYLGDGCIHWTGRSFQHRIALDSAHPEVIEDAAMALRMTMLRSNVYRRTREGWNMVTLESNSRDWPRALPQHGPGRKHLRPIILESWQRDIVEEHPWPFLKGLLHSDGCRSINRVKTTLPSGRYAVYEYPRWYFVNASEDILGLFKWTCELVDVRCTRSRERMITISKRDSVARVDKHVGLKM